MEEHTHPLTNSSPSIAATTTINEEGLVQAPPNGAPLNGRSFADITKRSKSKPRSTINLDELPNPGSRDDGTPSVMITPEISKGGREKWRHSLIGRLDFQLLKFQEAMTQLQQQWQIAGNGRFVLLTKGFFVIKLDNQEDKQMIRASPWYVNYVDASGVETKLHVRIQEWRPHFNPSTQKQSRAAVWVNFPSLGLEFWDEKSMFTIGKALGTPIQVDPNTLDPRFGFYARVLIDIDFSKTVHDSVWVEDDDGGFTQAIEIPNRPKFCFHCKCIGHLVSDCRNFKAEMNKESLENMKNSKNTKNSQRKKKDDVSNQVNDITPADVMSEPINILDELVKVSTEVMVEPFLMSQVVGPAHDEDNTYKESTSAIATVDVPIKLFPLSTTHKESATAPLNTPLGSHNDAFMDVSRKRAGKRQPPISPTHDPCSQFNSYDTLGQTNPNDVQLICETGSLGSDADDDGSYEPGLEEGDSDDSQSSWATNESLIDEIMVFGPKVTVGPTVGPNITGPSTGPSKTTTQVVNEAKKLSWADEAEKADKIRDNRKLTAASDVYASGLESEAHEETKDDFIGPVIALPAANQTLMGTNNDISDLMPPKHQRGDRKRNKGPPRPKEADLIQPGGTSLTQTNKPKRRSRAAIELHDVE